MGIPGAVAVARAGGEHAPGRRRLGEPAPPLLQRTLDAAELRKLPFEGDVAEPGVRGRLMNGGASLTVVGRRATSSTATSTRSSTGWPRRARDASRSTRWMGGSPESPLMCSSGAGDLQALAASLPRPESGRAPRAATRRWRDAAASVLEIAESLGRGATYACVGLLAKAALATARLGSPSEGSGPWARADRPARGAGPERGDSGSDRRPPV